MEWISITKQLPKEGERVLVCHFPNSPNMGGTVIDIDYRISTKGTALDGFMRKRIEWNLGFRNGLPTHWMPLPEKPELINQSKTV